MFEFLKPNPADKWLVENIKYYRTLGFFADLGKMKEKQLCEQVKKRLKPDSKATREFDGLDIVLVDTKRMWAHDKVDLDKDTNFWARAMDEWAAVSRGILRPVKMTVTKSESDGPTLIQFTQDSMLHSMYVNPNGDDWLDASVFHQLNQIFADTGFRFELCDKDTSMRYVLVLTPSEKSRLMKEKKWIFVT